jgi:hypothetical protein
MISTGATIQGKQRISFIDPDSVEPAMQDELRRCAEFGTPDRSFREGVRDHTIKELCRVYVSRSVKCEYRATSARYRPLRAA